jgi:hypothetical protein
MIGNQQLIDMKGRMFLAADVAEQIVVSPDVVRFDEEQYRVVCNALLGLRADLTALLADYDTYRAMFADRISQFVQETFTNEGGSSGNGGDSGNDVSGVAVAGDRSGGGEARPDETEASSPAPAKRASRKRRKRPDSGTDTASLPGTTGSVDSGAGESEMGGK